MPTLHARSSLAAESVFSVMSRLAARYGAVNLGQGFPAGSPPDFLLDALRAQAGTADQYTAPAGLPALREALAADLTVASTPVTSNPVASNPVTSTPVQPEQITVTCGATEALHTLADVLYGSGDEVLMFEPVFDIYRPQAHLSGAVPVLCPMTLTAVGWTPDLDALERLVTPRTRALLVNNPHNPSGHVFTRAELERIVQLARQHDLWIIADEVYDELYFGEAPVALRELAPECTFTVGSAGKRLEATGWRVGWIASPAGMASQVAGLHQWATFCAPAPLQSAVAAALPLARENGFYEDLRRSYGARMRLLASGLRSLGLEVQQPGGSYFLTALAPGLDARHLVEHGGVAVIPGSAFYAAGSAPEGLIRLAFCKPAREILEALERLEVYLNA